MSMPCQYPIDMTDAQWHRHQPLLPFRKWRPGGPGRPPCDVRQVINGIVYVTKTGCQWDMLPASFGRWKTVYGYFNRWSRVGHGQAMMEALTRQERRRQGRQPEPSAGSIDSQST
ncbi:MAG: transposase [Candidatus Latescibacteria bacterium]|nr:transposase [Candidatus Latescibacterota bacterium]